MDYLRDIARYTEIGERMVAGTDFEEFMEARSEDLGSPTGSLSHRRSIKEGAKFSEEQVS